MVVRHAKSAYGSVKRPHSFSGSRACCQYRKSFSHIGTILRARDRGIFCAFAKLNKYRKIFPKLAIDVFGLRSGGKVEIFGAVPKLLEDAISTNNLAQDTWGLTDLLQTILRTAHIF